MSFKTQENSSKSDELRELREQYQSNNKNDSLHFYSKTIKPSQAFRNIITIAETYILAINEQGFLFIYDISALNEIKLVKQFRFHCRLLNIIGLKQSDDTSLIRFGICDEFNIFLECKYDVTNEEIIFPQKDDLLFTEVEFKNNGININTFIKFDQIEDEEGTKLLTFNYNSILIITKEDSIYNKDFERQMILECKFLSRDQIVTIEDFNIVKLYQVDYIAGNLTLLDSFKLNEYCIYSNLFVLERSLLMDKKEADSNRRRRPSNKSHILVNGNDGRVLLIEIDSKDNLLKVASNSKIPIPKSLIANNKKTGANVLPMVVDVKTQKLSGNKGVFCLILTHLGDLLNIVFMKDEKNETKIQFSYFCKLEPLCHFNIVSKLGCLLTLPQFAVPKIYQINNINTKVIDQIKYDDLVDKTELDTLSLIAQLPNFFIKQPVLFDCIDSIQDNSLTINIDNLNTYNNSLKFNDQLNINVVDDADKINPDNVTSIQFNNVTKLISLSYNLVNKTRFLHFTLDDEINEIDATDKYNAGVFILKEYTIDLLQYSDFIFQITKNKINIIKRDGDKFMLFKRISLKDFIPEILEFNMSLEFHSCHLINNTSLLFFSMSNYKYIYIDIEELINGDNIRTSMMLPEIEPFNEWTILRILRNKFVLALITNDNILQLYDIDNIVVNDVDVDEEPIISKYFAEKITSMIMKYNDSCCFIHLGFDNGLYQIYQLTELNNLDLMLEQFLTIEKILLHSLDNVVVITSGKTQWVSYSANTLQLLKPICTKKIVTEVFKLVPFRNDLILKTNSKNTHQSFYKNEHFVNYGQVGAVLLNNNGDMILGKFSFDSIEYATEETEEEESESENQNALKKGSTANIEDVKGEGKSDEEDEEEKVDDGEDDDDDEEEEEEEIDIPTISHACIKQKHIYLKDAKNNSYDVIIDKTSFQIKYRVPQHLLKLYEGKRFGFTQSYEYAINCALLLDYADRKIYHSSQLGKYLLLGTSIGRFLLFKVNNNPKSKISSDKGKTSSVETQVIDMTNLSKSQKKRLKKKQVSTSSSDPNPKIEENEYDYNYLSLASDIVLDSSITPILILKEFNNKELLTSLHSSVLSVVKVLNNKLAIISQSPTLPSLNIIQKVDVMEAKYVVAADTSENLIYHKYVDSIKKFIPIADYCLSKTYIQTIKFLDYKTIIVSDRFGSISTLTIDWNLSHKQFESMEFLFFNNWFNGFETTDFSKNRKDNVWDAPFKFKKLNSMYIGDIVININHIPSTSKLRNNRDILICIGLQGSITILVPLISDSEVKLLKQCDELINQTNGKTISKFRFESTFTLSKNIFNGDYYENAETFEQDNKSLLQLLKNSTYLE